MAVGGEEGLASTKSPVMYGTYTRAKALYSYTLQPPGHLSTSPAPSPSHATPPNQLLQPRPPRPVHTRHHLLDPEIPQRPRHPRRPSLAPSSAVRRDQTEPDGPSHGAGTDVDAGVAKACGEADAPGGVCGARGEFFVAAGDLAVAVRKGVVEGVVEGFAGMGVGGMGAEGEEAPGDDGLEEMFWEKDF